MTLRDTVPGVTNMGHFPESCYPLYPRDVEKTHSIYEAEVMRWLWGQESTAHILEPWANEDIRAGAIAQ